MFLASDDYDYESSRAPNTYSVTTLLRPVRQVILSSRVSHEIDVAVNLSSVIPSKIGSAIHDGIESAWVNNYATALESLGHPKKFIDSIVINPADDVDLTGKVPVYTEIRTTKALGNFHITGKFDIAINGRIEDFKSTSVWTAINSTNTDQYIQQLSIYRWLNQDKITKDVANIHWIFTDWSANGIRTNVNYPPERVQTKSFKLMSLNETENFLRKKLSQLEAYKDAPEHELPECTDEDLWRSPSQWKYYKNRQSSGRSTKNYSTAQEAMSRLADDGFVGRVEEAKGVVKACKYCAAFLICSQKDRYISSGELVIDKY